MVCKINGILREDEKRWGDFTFKGESYLNNNNDSTSKITDKLYLDPYNSMYVAEKGFHIDYPDNKKFAVCLTHDVDDIYPPLYYTVLSSLSNLKKLDMQGLKQQLLWRVKGKDLSPYINFKDIIDIEDRFGATSSFYFIATDKDITRFRYDIEDLDGKLGDIVDRGCEVGLHGGYYAFDNPDEIQLEKKRVEKILNRPIVGYRNHFLKFRLPETWEHLARAGFKYDTTVGENRAIGFKNGLCHPFRPFNTLRNSEIDIIELPLVLPDFTLMNAGLPPARLWEITKGLIDSVESCSGVATVLWHSDAFNNSYREDWVKFYVKILEYCHSKNAWITSGKALCEQVEKQL